MPPTSTDSQAPIRAWVSLGSNLEPAANLRRAVEALAERLDLVAVSSLYASAAQGAPGNPSFLNAAVEIETTLSARQLKFDSNGTHHGPPSRFHCCCYSLWWGLRITR